ncbi:MAG TPA: hypothetical protein VM074_09640 [Solimonas sp.]|nr:hypothetical protein [Solimonas sp.]
MKIDTRFLPLALVSICLLGGCASNREREDNTQDKSSRMLDDEQARRDGYRQGYNDAQGQRSAQQPGSRLRSRLPTMPGDGFGAAPPLPLPGLPGGLP